MSVLLWILGIILLVYVGVNLCIFLFFWCVATGIGVRGKAIEDAWKYWERMKVNKWSDLSSQEQDLLVMAYGTIEDDCGGCMTEEEIRKYLELQMPVLKQNVGLDAKHYE